MSVDGLWDLTIATPIGEIRAEAALRSVDGTVQGTASGMGETVPLGGVRLDGNRLTWTQSVTRPVRLNLAFDMTVDGDTMTGTSRAGRLPASRVTGRRRPG